MIANYLDNSQMRNKIALDLAQQLGIGLEARFVDIWMNGEYLGNYILTPKYDYLAPKEGYALESDQFLEPEGGDPQFHLPDTWEIGKITGDEGYYNRITVKDIGSKAEKAGVNLSSTSSRRGPQSATMVPRTTRTTSTSTPGRGCSSCMRSPRRMTATQAACTCIAMV